MSSRSALLVLGGGLIITASLLSCRPSVSGPPAQGITPAPAVQPTVTSALTDAGRDTGEDEPGPEELTASPSPPAEEVPSLPQAACPPGDGEEVEISFTDDGRSIAEMFEPQILAYLNNGGDAENLQAALNRLTLDDVGEVWNVASHVHTADVTGDAPSEVIVDLLFYVEGQYANGALFIFRCEQEAYVGGTVARIGAQLFADQGPEPSVRVIQDLNADSIPEIVLSYVTAVGTHANYTRAFRVLSWDGEQFVDLIRADGSRPYVAAVLNGDGVIDDADGDGLPELRLSHGVGRGPDADTADQPRTDVWAWNGEAFVLVATVDPDTTTPNLLLGVFRPVADVTDVLPGKVMHLQESPNGGLWLVTDRTVAKWMDGTWSVRIKDYAGRPVGIDLAERIWVVSDDLAEISAWNGVSWTAYGAEAGWTPLSRDWFRSAAWGRSDGSGWLWLATSEDVRAFSGERWLVYTPQDMGMAGPVYDDLEAEFGLTILSSGDVWVRECDWGGPGPFGGRGARWFDGQAWRGADSPVASGCVNAIEENDAGDVWLGVNDELWRYEPTSGEWTPFTPPEPPIAGMRFGFVHAISFDSSGDPWPAMVLCGGASCYGQIALYLVHDGAWTRVGEPLEFGGNLLPHRLVTDAGGTSWLFWGGAIHRLAGDKLEPVPDFAIRSDAVEADGQIWLVAVREGRNVVWALDLPN